MDALINIIAVLAVIAGIVIGAACSGILAFITAITLAWGGAVVLLDRKDWIRHF